MTVNVGVFGASGYTGQELLELLAHHPAMITVFAVSDSLAGTPVPDHAIHYIPKQDVTWQNVDLVFLCTPHGASALLGAEALRAGVKVVDLSADLRLNTPETYQHWYQQTHPAPDLLPTPYGLPELNRQYLNGTNRIANPGCYPTATLLALLPLLKAQIVQPGTPIIVDAKSGVSGAGHTPKPHTHFVEVFGDLKPYSIGRVHRHTGEIEQEICGLFPDAGPVIFAPHLLPVDRGLMASVYVSIVPGWTDEQIQDVFHDYYGAEPLVEVLPAGQIARLKDAVRTNKAVLSVHHPTLETVMIVSVIDNLRKGAASQAIQNANLLCDIPETAGLLED